MIFPPPPDGQTEQLTFIVFLLGASAAFAFWQHDVTAGCFMFFALYLMAP